MVRAMSDPRDRMKAFINRIAPVPPLSDPADAISASLVAGAIAFLLVSVILFVIVSAAAGRMPAVYALTLPIGIVLLVTLRWVLRRGHVRSAAYALCAFGWLLVAVDVQQRGPDTLSVGGFIVLTVIGGLTLGPRGTVALTAATVALLVSVAVAPGDQVHAGQAELRRALRYPRTGAASRERLRVRHLRRRQVDRRDHTVAHPAGSLPERLRRLLGRQGQGRPGPRS